MNAAISEFKPFSTALENGHRQIVLDFEKVCPFLELTQQKKCVCQAIIVKGLETDFRELGYYDILKCSTIWQGCPDFQREERNQR